MKWIASVSLALISLLLLASCSALASRSIPATTSSEAEFSMPVSSSQANSLPSASAVQEIVRNYNRANFALAPEYNYVAIGYFTDDDLIPRDAYIPYSEPPIFGEGYIQSINHGISVKVWVSKEYDNAKSALMALKAMPTSITLAGAPHADLQDTQCYELGGSTYDNDTVGSYEFACRATPAQGDPLYILSVKYADIRGNGYYMLAELDFDSSSFDEQTPMLAAELSDAYGLRLPSSAQEIQTLITENPNTK